MKFLDLCGRRFRRLVAQWPAGRDKTKPPRTCWLCLCDCGNLLIVPTGRLTSGNTKSCGCLKPQRISEVKTTHGHTAGGLQSPTYRSWYSMLARCYRPSSSRYYAYGHLGIKVCERWRTFENFLADMGERPPGKTLDRINPYGHYDPSNCRWATDLEQARNRRPKPDRWTRDGHGCKVCGTTARPHCSFGMCENCYRAGTRGYRTKRLITRS